MKLSFEQIKSITTGAVDFKSDENGVSFFRFTSEQSESYRERNVNFYRNVFATAGIKLRFKTDSERLRIRIVAERAGTRRYFSLDIFVDGKHIDSIDNFSDKEIPKNYHAMLCESGEFDKSLSFGRGVKTICIHFPWSQAVRLVDMEVDDDAFIEPVKHSKKLLAFGDSITQGYDALRPSSRYVAKLCEALGADETNKAIGGETFWPQLSALRDDFVPDYITVAYGTNDWSHSKLPDSENFDGFVKNCNSFFENLRKNYPDSKIFAITPLWRQDWEDTEPDWKFSEMEEIIRRAAEKRDVTVISGFELIPHDTDLFGDLRLHPNDDGFNFYFENLYKEIKSKL